MNSFFSKNFKNKKILITGHNGFKGTWLTLWLLKYNAKIIGISLKKSNNNKLYNSLLIEKKIKSYYFDISKNLKKLKRIINKEKPDYIFNLAAQAIVSKSFTHPEYTIKNNIGINVNLLEVLKNYEKKVSVIMVTSDKVYQNIEQLKSYKENDRLGGKDIYSASKSASEIIFNAYFQSFLNKKKNLLFGIARAGNVIGGGDWSKDRLIPDVFRSWKDKKLLKIRSPKATRPWEFVLEPLSGYLLLSIKLRSNKKLNGQAFNFSSLVTNNLSVLEMVKNLSKARKKRYSKYLINQKNLKFNEAKILNLNPRKAYKLLNWKSVMKLSDIISFISAWYQHYEEKKDLKNITEQQLDSYIKLLNQK